MGGGYFGGGMGGGPSGGNPGTGPSGGGPNSMGPGPNSMGPGENNTNAETFNAGDGLGVSGISNTQDYRLASP